MDYNFHDCKQTIQNFSKSLIFIMSLAFLLRIYGYGLYQVPSESMETTMLVGERFFADKFSMLFWSPKHKDIIAFNDPKYNYSPNPFINWFQMQIYGPVNITKRIIGCPGDEIYGSIEEGKPKIYLKKKGETSFSLLDEPYLNKYSILAVCPKKSFTNRPFEYRSYDTTQDNVKKNIYKLTSEEISNGVSSAKSYGQKPIITPGTPTRFDNFKIKLDEDHYWVMGDNRLASSDSRSIFGPIHKKFIHGKIKYRLLSFNSNEEWWLLDLIKHPIDFWKNIRWNRCFQSVI